MIALAFCGYAAIHTDTAIAANLTIDEKKLDRLRAGIRALTAELDRKLSRQHQLREELRLTDRRIGKLIAVIRQLDHQIKQQNAELNQLRNRQKVLREALALHQANLTQQIRNAYLMGQQHSIKLILNQQDPSAISRTLTYYNYFNKARISQIDRTQSTLSILHDLQAKIARRKQSLADTRQSRLQDHQAVRSDRARRSVILAKLDSQITEKGARLKLLHADEKRLASLINRISEQLMDIPKLETRYKAFSLLKGKLPWPIIGRLIARYGHSRNIGDLKWRGILIESTNNRQVRAVSHGRVAFAAWLRGFGLLMIIDHGGGYMSLYGRNESLFKEVGEWVKTDESIAAIGDRTGLNRQGLYFEIRRNGKPTNPLNWLSRKNP